MPVGISDALFRGEEHFLSLCNFKLMKIAIFVYFIILLKPGSNLTASPVDVPKKSSPVAGLISAPY